MAKIATIADKIAFENEMPWEDRMTARTLHQFVGRAQERFPDNDALSFQITSGVKDKAETLTWTDLLNKTTQAANMFRRLGIGETDVVAFLLPNANETVLTLLGGATAGIVNPINPLLEPEMIGAILRETGAKMLVTLRAFPKSDVAQKAAIAVALAPNIETVLEVDLLKYLTPPKSWIVPLIRPKNPITHKAKVLDFNTELAKQRWDALDFEESKEDRVAAYFHTGGTTGMPKVATHKFSGIIYNGWVGSTLIIDESDVLLCPLPLFHVLAAYPALMSVISAGAHIVLPTPQGYRGDNVFDNFWKLVERWKVSFIVGVPTAMSILMQREVDADVSTLKYAFSGSAPLPVELFKKFEGATGVKILEGYGMTEATCLMSFNPLYGERKIGSVGLPVPYTDIRILECDDAGTILKEFGVDEIGEICVANPGVVMGATYTEADKNIGIYAGGTHFRTGDLGRVDEDGYVWITGRAKDMINRGGHEIDPALIEEALMGHPDVAFAGAIGQPDLHSGELPCVYVELAEGSTATIGELTEFVEANVVERAAVPRYIEIVDELPKTAVGKIFKPELRMSAIKRIFNAKLAADGVKAEVAEVVQDKKLGLIAFLQKNSDDVDDAAVNASIGGFTRPWEWKA